jgi:hypothetical protein
MYTDRELLDRLTGRAEPPPELEDLRLHTRPELCPVCLRLLEGAGRPHHDDCRRQVHEVITAIRARMAVCGVGR